MSYWDFLNFLDLPVFWDFIWDFGNFLDIWDLFRILRFCKRKWDLFRILGFIKEFKDYFGF